MSATPRDLRRTPGALEARRLLREASLELARLRRIRGASHRTWRRIARAQARLACAAALLAAAAAATPALAGTPVFSRGPLPDVGSYASPELADIDGDGDLDAFVGEDRGNTLFFRNTGTTGAPAFAAPSTNPFGLADVGGTNDPPAAPAFADIDGDGDLDAFIAQVFFGGQILFFRNSGTTTTPAFASPSTSGFGLPSTPGSPPTFADIEGDGDLDLFAGTRFFENTGTALAPAFAAVVSNPFGLANAGAASRFADFDADGDLDAFVGNHLGNLIFFANSGTANAPAFAPPSTNPFGLGDLGAIAAPAFADLDGDGDLDAFVGEAGGNTLFLPNRGTASAPAFDISRVGLVKVDGFASPALADLDADGDLDACIGEFDGNTFCFENTGTASAPAFAPPSTNPFGLADVGLYATPAFTDIDGDGDLDAFVGEQGQGTFFFENTGTAGAPAFGSPVANAFGLANVGDNTTPTFADIDGDGDEDAFVGLRSGAVFMFRNTGSVTAPAFYTPLEGQFFGLWTSGSSYVSPDFTDLDGDGDFDAFVGNGAGNTLFFRNTGTASTPAFATQPTTNPFGLAKVGGSYATASPAAADIDGDGDIDVFVGENPGNTFFFENIEIGPGTCADGRDNDFDGQSDSPADPGCASAADTDEKSTLECDNGVDDDGDGKIDWRGNGTGDPHCVNLSDWSEAAPPAPGCGIGPELLLLGPLLGAARRRRERRK